MIIIPPTKLEFPSAEIKPGVADMSRSCTIAKLIAHRLQDTRPTALDVRMARGTPHAKKIAALRFERAAEEVSTHVESLARRARLKAGGAYKLQECLRKHPEFRLIRTAALRP